VLFVAERVWPLRQRKYPQQPRIYVNAIFTIFVLCIAALLIGPIVKYMLQFTHDYSFGLLHLYPIPAMVSMILGFLLMDLTMYYWHWMNHKIPWLWRFHNVHHVDPDLDVTTSMRFHMIEIAYSSIFRIIQISLIGLDPIIFISYELVFQCNTFFHHSNIKLPIQLERILNKIMVTPRMHGIHHSDYRDETDRNYGIVFSFWDHMHRTIKLNIAQININIGVPAYQKPKDNTLINLLVMPFRQQKNYWILNNDKKHLFRETSQDLPINTLAE
jgi:sterol desaturase/sphingolipid hydroxylase (fatty acid hydroxylase superfamily)